MTTNQTGKMDSIEIEIPTMYANKVRSMDASRVIGEAIAQLDAALDVITDENTRDAIYANIRDLEQIQHAMGATTSAIRSALIKQEMAQS